MFQRSRRFVAVGALGALALAGCSAKEGGSGLRSEGGPVSETVQVRKRDITPVLTLPGTVVSGPEVAATSPVAGGFAPRPGIAVGAQVIAGQPLGDVAGKPIVSTAPGTVRNLTATGEVPANFPVATVAIRGFAINSVVPPEASWVLVEPVVTGKAQISNAPEPFNCAAVALPAPGQATAALPAGSQVAASAPEEGGEEGAAPPEAGPGAGAGGPQATQGTIRFCLVPPGNTVSDGIGVTVQLSAPVRAKVLALPLTAVAGRRDKGAVTLVKDGKRTRQAVTLGGSDGRYVEIRSGLEDGEQVESIAPDLHRKSADQ